MRAKIDSLENALQIIQSTIATDSTNWQSQAKSLKKKNDSLKEQIGVVKESVS